MRFEHRPQRRLMRASSKVVQQEEEEEEVSLLPQLLLEWQDTQEHGCGFINLGNTCFLNSVLQCLVHLPPWAQLCRIRAHRRDCQLDQTDEKCVACLLEKRVVRSLMPSTPAADAPNGLVNNMTKSISQQLLRGRQEDAHEFLRFLLEAVERDMLRTLRGPQPIKARLEPTTLIQHVFGGTLESTVTCGSCGVSSHTRDPLLDISLELTGCASVAAALAKFSASEQLAGSNAYKCGACKTKGDAKKQLAILEAPHVLVVHLKRFGGPGGVKIARHIAFEERISLRSFCSPSSPEIKPPKAAKAVSRKDAEPSSPRKPAVHPLPDAPRFGTGAQLTLDQPDRQPPSRVQVVAPLQQPQVRFHGPQLRPPALQQQRAIGPQPLGVGPSSPAAAVSAAAKEEEEEKPASALPDNSPEYKLYGVLVHQGVSANSGHYYAFIRDGTSTDGDWHRMNDAVTYRCSWAKVSAENAYMLFYVRTSERHYPTLASAALKAEKKRLREQERQARKSALWKAGKSEPAVRSAEATADEAAAKRRRFGFSVDAAERTWHTGSHIATDPAPAPPPPHEPVSCRHCQLGPSGKKLAWGAAPAAAASSPAAAPPAESAPGVQLPVPQPRLLPHGPPAHQMNGVSGPSDVSAASAATVPPPWLAMPPPDLLFGQASDGMQPVGPPASVPVSAPGAEVQGVDMGAHGRHAVVIAPLRSPQQRFDRFEEPQQEAAHPGPAAGQVLPQPHRFNGQALSMISDANTNGGDQPAPAAEPVADQPELPVSAQLSVDAAVSLPEPAVKPEGPPLPAEAPPPDEPPVPEYGPQMPIGMQTAIPSTELRQRVYTEAKSYMRDASWCKEVQKRLREWRAQNPDSDWLGAKAAVLEGLQVRLPEDAKELVQRLLSES